MNNNTQLEQLIIEGIQERKGRRIALVDMAEIESAPTRMFVIAEGNTPTQVGAIADSVREYVQQQSGIKPYNYDGYQNSEWIVIDYGDIMAHIFVPADRERYNLEDLWSDAVITDVPDLD